jgi:alpha-tubulin suppressor-like RCC1 family protein
MVNGCCRASMSIDELQRELKKRDQAIDVLRKQLRDQRRSLKAKYKDRLLRHIQVMGDTRPVDEGALEAELERLHEAGAALPGASYVHSISDSSVSATPPAHVLVPSVQAAPARAIGVSPMTTTGVHAIDTSPLPTSSVDSPPPDSSGDAQRHRFPSATPGKRPASVPRLSALDLEDEWEIPSRTNLWAWGGSPSSKSRLPCQIPLGPVAQRRLVEVSASDTRVAIVTDTGDVYMWDTPLVPPEPRALSEAASLVRQARPELHSVPSALAPLEALSKISQPKDSALTLEHLFASETASEALVRIGTVSSRWLLDQHVDYDAAQILDAAEAASPTLNTAKSKGGAKAHANVSVNPEEHARAAEGYLAQLVEHHNKAAPLVAAIRASSVDEGSGAVVESVCAAHHATKAATRAAQGALEAVSDTTSRESVVSPVVSPADVSNRCILARVAARAAVAAVLAAQQLMADSLSGAPPLRRAWSAPLHEADGDTPAPLRQPALDVARSRSPRSAHLPPRAPSPLSSGVRPFARSEDTSTPRTRPSSAPRSREASVPSPVHLTVDKLKAAITHLQVAAASAESAAACLCRAVWAWRQSARNDKRPPVLHLVRALSLYRALRGPAARVVQVACGPRHCLARTAAGEVLSWGCSLDGRLGYRTPLAEHPPRVIGKLVQAGVQAAWVAVGDAHSIIVGRDGSLWACGSGKQGCLGTGNQMMQWEPEQIKSSGGLPPDPWFGKQSRRRHRHSVSRGALGTDLRSVASSVANDDDDDADTVNEASSHKKRPSWIASVMPQSTGEPTRRSTAPPTQLAAIHMAATPTIEAARAPLQGLTLRPWSGGVGVWKVACGASHTVAIARDGRLFGWGSSEFGQTGAGFAAAGFLAPHIVTFPDKTRDATSARHAKSASDARTEAPGGAIRAVRVIASVTSPAVRWSEWRPRKGVMDIACGSFHTVAALADGRCLAWGLDVSGQVSGTKPSKTDIMGMKSFYSPRELPLEEILAKHSVERPLPPKAATVAAGQKHSLCSLEDGVVVAWGKNDCFQVGSTEGESSHLGLTAVHLPRRSSLPRQQSWREPMLGHSMQRSQAWDQARLEVLKNGGIASVGGADHTSTTSMTEEDPLTGVESKADSVPLSAMSNPETRKYAVSSALLMSARRLCGSRSLMLAAGGSFSIVVEGLVPAMGYRPVDKLFANLEGVVTGTGLPILDRPAEALELADRKAGDSPDVWDSVIQESVEREGTRAAHEHRWSALRTMEQVVTAKHSGELAKLIEETGGIPPASRRIVWPVLVGNAANVTPAFYHESLRKGRALVAASLRSKVKNRVRLVHKKDRSTGGGWSASVASPLQAEWRRSNASDVIDTPQSPGMGPSRARSRAGMDHSSPESTPLLRTVASLDAIPPSPISASAHLASEAQSPHPSGLGDRVLHETSPLVAASRRASPVSEVRPGQTRARNTPIGAWAEAFLIGPDDPMTAESDAAAVLDAYFSINHGHGEGSLDFLSGETRRDASGEANREDDEDLVLSYATMNPAEAAGALASLSGGLAGPGALFAAGPSADERRRIFDVEALAKDLGRTYNNVHLFDADGPLRRELTEVVVALIGALVEFGYAQAMSYQVAALLLHMGSPYLAFQVYYNMIMRPEMRIFLRGDAKHSPPEESALLSSLRVKFVGVCFDAVRSEGLPTLDETDAARKARGKSPFPRSSVLKREELYVVNWLQALFMAHLPFPEAMVCLDMYLLHGAKTLPAIVLACHRAIKPVLEAKARTMRYDEKSCFRGIPEELMLPILFSPEGTTAEWKVAVRNGNFASRIVSAMRDLPQDSVDELSSMLSDPFLFCPFATPQGIGPLETGMSGLVSGVDTAQETVIASRIHSVMSAYVNPASDLAETASAARSKAAPHDGGQALDSSAHTLGSRNVRSIISSLRLDTLKDVPASPDGDTHLATRTVGSATQSADPDTYLEQ